MFVKVIEFTIFLNVSIILFEFDFILLFLLILKSQVTIFNKLKYILLFYSIR